MKCGELLCICCMAMLLFLTACQSDWAARGYRQYQRGNYDRAIRDFGITLRSDPTNTTALFFRALSFEQIGRNDSALSDFQSALETAPSLAYVYVARAELYYRTHDFTNAMSDYMKALDIGFSDSRLYCGYAWLLAACPDSKLRNGHSALEVARQAVALKADIYSYCVLAAALAEVGDYPAAVEATRTARQMVNVNNQFSLLKRIDWCLALYEAQEPWRPKDDTDVTMPGVEHQQW